MVNGPQYERGMSARRPEPHTSPMIRRLVALALWAYFAWYLAAMVATVIGASSLAGPTAAVLTIAAGALSWARAQRAARPPQRTAEPQPSR